MTEVWPAGNIQAGFRLALGSHALETRMETLRLAGFYHSVSEIGIAVQLSWKPCLPFQNKLKKPMSTKIQLGTSWVLYVWLACRQADDVHGVLLFVMERPGACSAPLSHEGIQVSPYQVLLLEVFETSSSYLPWKLIILFYLNTSLLMSYFHQRRMWKGTHYGADYITSDSLVTQSRRCN